MDASLLVLEAAAVRDAQNVDARPGAVAVRNRRIVAAGPLAMVARAIGHAPAERVRLVDELILPAFVNAHAHLDLTTIGSIPYRGSFVGWAEEVMAARPTADDAIRAAVHRGLALSRQSGTGWVGDIAGDERAIFTRAAAAPPIAVPGVSWLECFGLGSRAMVGADRAESRLAALRADPALRESGLRIDLQPHAPYSAGAELYARAAALGKPSSHLAETREELEFVAHACGPFADLLHRLGLWDDSITPREASPVEVLAAELAAASWVLAHGNYLEDDDIAWLARHTSSIAYCPIASEYFGHRAHPYRHLLAVGVNVCLGTDSILCQPAGEPQPLGIWPQMRRLWARDRVDPAVLLAMATVNGARALDLEPGAATLAPGAPARLVAVAFDPTGSADPLEQALAQQPAVRALNP